MIRKKTKTQKAACSNTIPSIIFEQLGGKDAVDFMIGLQNIIELEDGVQFDFETASDHDVYRCKIVLNGKDLYDLTFTNTQQISKTQNDVFAEDLMDFFENSTRLFLTLYPRS